MDICHLSVAGRNLAGGGGSWQVHFGKKIRLSVRHLGIADALQVKSVSRGAEGGFAVGKTRWLVEKNSEVI